MWVHIGPDPPTVTSEIFRNTMRKFWGSRYAAVPTVVVSSLSRGEKNVWRVWDPRQKFPATPLLMTHAFSFISAIYWCNNILSTMLGRVSAIIFRENIAVSMPSPHISALGTLHPLAPPKKCFATDNPECCWSCKHEKQHCHSNKCAI